MTAEKMVERTKKLIIMDRLQALFQDANREASEPAIKNISENIDLFFNGCETYNDAFRRVCELDDYLFFSTQY